MHICVIAVILAASGAASADAFSEATPEAKPLVAMQDYFDGEITGGWTLMGMGTANLALTGFLFADGSDRAQGGAYATLGFGVAHLAAGIYVNIASRVRKRVYRVAIDKAPKVWATAESHRMKGVATQFLVLKIVEVVLIAGGGTMAYFGNAKDKPQLEGAGYALAAEAAVTLLFDIWASRRASRYRDRLSEIDLGITADAAGEPVLLFGRTMRF